MLNNEHIVGDNPNSGISYTFVLFMEKFWAAWTFSGFWPHLAHRDSIKI